MMIVSLYCNYIIYKSVEMVNYTYGEPRPEAKAYSIVIVKIPNCVRPRISQKGDVIIYDSNGKPHLLSDKLTRFGNRPFLLLSQGYVYLRIIARRKYTYQTNEKRWEHMKATYIIPNTAGKQVIFNERVYRLEEDIEYEIEERYPGEPESAYPLDQIPVEPTAPVKRDDSNDDSAALMVWYLPNVEALDAWAEAGKWNQHISGIITSEE